MIDIKKAEEEFKKFTDKYDKNNNKINLKIDHTFRVEKNSKIIAESLGLDEENVLLATLIGLLHDIGRFEQVKRYDSFNDFLTADHATLGVEILKENNYISKYAKEKYWNTIFNSVENHNKFNIDESLNDFDTLHSNIIRDADKLDILNIYIERVKNKNEKNIERKNEIFEKFISYKLIDDLQNKKIIKKQDKKYVGDSYLLALGFIYDFNFKISYKIIKENNYINKLIDEMKKQCVNEKEINWLEEIRRTLNIEIEKRIKS